MTVGYVHSEHASSRYHQVLTCRQPSNVGQAGKLSYIHQVDMHSTHTVDCCHMCFVRGYFCSNAGSMVKLLLCSFVFTENACIMVSFAGVVLIAECGAMRSGFSIVLNEQKEKR